MNSKRGISPLIATVLLVAFSLILAAIVSNFILKKTRDFNPSILAEDSVFCDSVNLGYGIDQAQSLKLGKYEEGLSPNPFAASGTLPSGTHLFGPFNLTNKGTFSIKQLIITAPGKGSKTFPIFINGVPGQLAPAQSKEFYVSLDFGSSLGDEIKIVPIIKDTEKNQFVRCPTKQVVFRYNQLCNEVTGHDCCVCTSSICTTTC